MIFMAKCNLLSQERGYYSRVFLVNIVILSYDLSISQGCIPVSENQLRLRYLLILFAFTRTFNENIVFLRSINS